MNLISGHILPPPRINRNIVECKETLYKSVGGVHCSINRNIVECKGSEHTGSKWNVVSINRNIVECKVLCVDTLLLEKAVLIETLWNVKYAELSAQDKADKY